MDIYEDMRIKKAEGDNWDVLTVRGGGTTTIPTFQFQNGGKIGAVSQLDQGKSPGPPAVKALPRWRAAIGLGEVTITAYADMVMPEPTTLTGSDSVAVLNCGKALAEFFGEEYKLPS